MNNIQSESRNIIMPKRKILNKTMVNFYKPTTNNILEEELFKIESPKKSPQTSM